MRNCLYILIGFSFLFSCSDKGKKLSRDRENLKRDAHLVLVNTAQVISDSGCEFPDGREYYITENGDLQLVRSTDSIIDPWGRPVTAQELSDGTVRLLSKGEDEVEESDNLRLVIDFLK